MIKVSPTTHVFAIFYSSSLPQLVISQIHFSSTHVKSAIPKFDPLEIEAKKGKVRNSKKSSYLKILKSLSIFVTLLTWPLHIMLEIKFYLYCIFYALLFLPFTMTMTSFIFPNHLHQSYKKVNILMTIELSF